MPYPRKYDYDMVIALWNEGCTTLEIGRVICPEKARPNRTIALILRDHFKINLAAENRRKYFGKGLGYPAEEVALWKQMRPKMTVMEIWRERVKVVPRLRHATVYRHTENIKGPMGWTYIKGSEKLEARRLYQQYGWHIRDIALRFGKADTTIRKYIGQIDDFIVPARKRQPNYMIHASMLDIATRALGRNQPAYKAA